MSSIVGLPDVRFARRIGIVLGGGGLLLVVCAGPAPAQSLQDQLQSVLANNCAVLEDRGNLFGPQLGQLCAIGGPPGVTVPPSGLGLTPTNTFGADPGARRNGRPGGDGETGGSGAPDANEMTFSLGGLSGFATATYERSDKDTTGFDQGYRANRYGLTVGVDRKFGPVVAGVAFDYSNTNADFSGAGGGFDTDSYGGLVYASVSPVEAAYIDLSAGYARKDYSLSRAITFIKGGTTVSGIANGDTNGDEYRAGASGGYDFTHENFTFGPRLALNYAHTEVDTFTEFGQYRARNDL